MIHWNVWYIGTSKPELNLKDCRILASIEELPSFGSFITCLHDSLAISSGGSSKVAVSARLNSSDSDSLDEHGSMSKHCAFTYML